jgi:hypothetical protein
MLVNYIWFMFYKRKKNIEGGYMNYEGRGKNWFEIYKYKNWFEIYFIRWKRKNCLRYVKMMSGVR